MSRRDDEISANRTYLFVPGDQPDKLARADERGADAIIADLEDAIAPSRKAEARQAVAGWLAKSRAARSQRWVRVNAGHEGREDLAALRDTDFDGLMIPKIGTPEELSEWVDDIDALLPATLLIVLIETASLLRRMDEAAANHRVAQLMIGEADLAADAGIHPEAPAWDGVRTDVVMVSAAAGLPAPIGPVDPEFRSPERLLTSTRHLKMLGFGARAVIHPAQIEPVHQGLRPTEDEIAEARRQLDRHRRSLAEGQGVHVGDDGEMVDEAYVRRARLLLENASRYERG